MTSTVPAPEGDRPRAARRALRSRRAGQRVPAPLGRHRRPHVSQRSGGVRPEIDIAGETTRVLVEQLGAVDAQQLGDLVGHVTREEMWGIDEALATVLDLD